VPIRGGDVVEDRAHQLGEEGGADARDEDGRRFGSGQNRPRSDADEEDARGEIDIGPLEADHLPDPHPRRPEQPEQLLAGERPGRRLRLAGRLHQAQYLRLFPQARRRTLVTGAHDAVRRDLGRRVYRIQVTDDAAHRCQSMRYLDRLDAFWELGEGDSELSGQRRRAVASK
jgi:hypothetical protein